LETAGFADLCLTTWRPRLRSLSKAKQKNRPKTLAASENFLEAEVEIYSFDLPSPDGTLQRHGQHSRLAQPNWKLMFIKKSYCTQRDLRKFSLPRENYRPRKSSRISFP
jgi:hypothetical protein